MMKLPQEDLLQALKVEKEKSLAPAMPVEDDLEDLPDIGFVDPSDERKAEPSYQDILKKITTPMHDASEQETILAEYQALKPKRMVAAEETPADEPELSLDNYNPTVAQNEPSASEMSKPLPPAAEKLSSQQSLLEQYKQLMDQKQNTNRNLDLLQGGNQIAQAIASGYGGKIGDGSEAVNQLRKTAAMPGEDLLNQSKAADTQNELEMVDPNSDISKFARQRAVAQATKMGLKPEELAKLESMSAKQLEKLGFKLDAQSTQASRMGLFYTTVRDENGKDRVVGVDRQTGEQVVDLGGKAWGDKIIKDEQTGLSQVYTQGAGLSALDQGNVSQASAIKNVKTPEGEKVEANKPDYNTPTSLNKMSPELYKKFNRIQEDLVKDMKDSREVATSASLLSSKLTPGANGNIDSGLLGGIQTQAAKMSGQKGVLTDQDLVKFAGAGGVSASIDRIIDGSMFGNMSDQDLKFFKSFAKKMQSATAEDINNRSQLFVNQIHNEAKDYLPGLTPDNVKKWMQVDSIAPSVQGNQDKKDSKVEEYAKTHNLDYNQAKAILAKRGYKPNE